MLGDELGGIPYSSSITVNLIYDEAKIGALPEGFGFLVPAVEGRAMLACTFVHRKFLGRTPPGKAVFRAFLGGMKREALLAESDEALVATVRREMSEILGAKTIERRRCSRSMRRCRAGGGPWRSMPWATRSGCSGLTHGWPRCRGCGLWAMPTTASAFPTAFGWGGRRRGSCRRWCGRKLRFG